MSKAKKVSKTRKMKMKQRLRHRKSRVIKTKSRKNRYRRTPKYKVGGGNLDSIVFRGIRNFIQENSDNVTNAENAYKALYTQFNSVAEPCFDPETTTGTFFNKKSRLRDILEKINSTASTQDTRDVGESKDYNDLNESLKKLQRKQAEETQANIENARKLQRSQQPQPQPQQQPQQQYYKVFIPDSNMVTVPPELGLFELGSFTPVTKIPYSEMPFSSKSITLEEYDDAPGTPIAIIVGIADRSPIVCNYKLSQNSGMVYHLKVDGGGINDVMRELFSSKKYECHIPTTVPNCVVIMATTEPPLRDDKKQLVNNLWSRVNCLLQRYPDFFTKIKNLKIVSPPSGGTLNNLRIKTGTGTYSYSSGTFSDGDSIIGVKVTPELNAAQNNSKGMMEMYDRF